MSEEKEGRAHAIIMPWPICQGIRTWCGYDCAGEEIKGEFIAAVPENVTCSDCKRAMAEALGNLAQWVPKLRAEKRREEP